MTTMSAAMRAPPSLEPRHLCAPISVEKRCNAFSGEVVLRRGGARLALALRNRGECSADSTVDGWKLGKAQRSRNWDATRAIAKGQQEVQIDQNWMQELEKAKMDLLRAVMDTKRGAQVTTEQRAAIEEAMVGVEKFNAGIPLVLDQLHGSWLLQYTTASEIISLIQAADQFPLLQVGQVYQCFDCKGRTDGGTVENIVRWSVSGLLQKNEGATFNVVAKFAVVGSRSIVIQKEEARLGEVEISEELESFIAPALLPRTFINFQLLMFLRSLDLRFPLGIAQIQPTNFERASSGARYSLTFLDKNLLLGRILDNGDIFVFSRTQARRESK